MNYSSFQEVKQKFHVDDVKKDRAELYSLRKQFVKKFSIERIKDMKLDDYVEGKGSKDSFCYWVERRLDKLGCIRGAFSTMFGVYYSAEQNDYWFAPKYGDSYKSAFATIKQEIISLLEAGETHNLASIEKNLLAPMFKGKILALYYPDEYLNIFSGKHLIHYLKTFNLDTESLVRQDPIYRREALVNYKNKDEDMKKWSMDLFGVFLYTYFPPTSEEDSDESFPTTDRYSFVNLNIALTPFIQAPKERSISKKVNYEREARKYRKYGDRGEKIVMKAEKDRLMNELHLSRTKAEKAVVQKSMESDSYGYDILSLNDDGTKRYIEVKATSGKVGDVNFYYTQNEYEKAQEYKENYYLYIVFEILSINPKIWIVKNPFLSDEVSMQPVQYKVCMRTQHD